MLRGFKVKAQCPKAYLNHDNGRVLGALRGHCELNDFRSDSVDRIRGRRLRERGPDPNVLAKDLASLPEGELGRYTVRRKLRTLFRVATRPRERINEMRQ